MCASHSRTPASDHRRLSGRRMAATSFGRSVGRGKCRCIAASRSGCARSCSAASARSRQCLPCRQAGRRFFIKEAGFGCATADRRQGSNLHNVQVGADRDRNLLPDAHRVGGLGTRSGDLDVAGRDRLAGQRPRLEEARGPQPFVEAHRGAFAISIVRHATCIVASTREVATVPAQRSVRAAMPRVARPGPWGTTRVVTRPRG